MRDRSPKDRPRGGPGGGPAPGSGARASRGQRPPRGHLPVTAAFVLLALGLVAVFVGLALHSGADSALSGWDRRVTQAFMDWRTTGRSHLFWTATLVGDDSLLAAFCFSTVLLLFVWGRRGRAALIAGSLLVAWAISEGAKAVVGRVRPPVADALIALPGSHSLPSGHALTTLVFLGMLAFLAWSAWGGAAARGAPAAGRAGAGGWAAFAATVAVVAVVGLVGVSRVYLGAHWMSDVLGGWCLGGAWLVAFLGLARPWWVWSAARHPAGAAGPRGRIGAFLARRPTASPPVRVTAVLFVVALCLAAAILTGWAGPLLRNM